MKLEKSVFTYDDMKKAFSAGEEKVNHEWHMEEFHGSHCKCYPLDFNDFNDWIKKYEKNIKNMEKINKKPGKKLELLNSEGPILIARRMETSSDIEITFTQIKGKKVEIITMEDLVNFLNCKCNIGKYDYSEYPESMKPSTEMIEKFIRNK